MNSLRRLRPVLIIGGLVLLVRLAGADEPKGSHVKIPPTHNGPDARQLFEERLRELNQRDVQMKQLRDQFQQLVGEKKWNDLIEKFEKGELKSNDPRLLEEIKKLMAQPGSGTRPQLSPEEAEKLKQWLQKAFPNARLPGMPTTGQEPSPTETPNPPVEPPPPTQPPPAVPGSQPPANVPDEAARARAAEQIMRWARDLERVAGRLEDSPALQQALRDLSQYALEMQARNLPADQRLDTQLAQFNRYFQDSETWLRDLRQAVGPIDFPELPRINTSTTPRLPSVSRLPSIRVPRRLGDLPGGSGGGQQLLGLILLLLVLFLLWKLSGRLLQAVGERGQASWKLGPWPLDPARIASRADLVLAFEYLSLLRLGYPARSWNHLEIAGRLGADSDKRRQAATQLAGLYEQARYAPGEAPLTTEDIAAARRDVCFLAGVAGA